MEDTSGLDSRLKAVERKMKKLTTDVVEVKKDVVEVKKDADKSKKRFTKRTTCIDQLSERVTKLEDNNQSKYTTQASNLIVKNKVFNLNGKINLLFLLFPNFYADFNSYS